MAAIIDPFSEQSGVYSKKIPRLTDATAEYGVLAYPNLIVAIVFSLSNVCGHTECMPV